MDIQAELKKVEKEIQELEAKDKPTEDEEIRLDGLVVKQRTLAAVAEQIINPIPMPGIDAQSRAADEYTERGVVGGLANPGKLFHRGRVPSNGRTMAQYVSDVIQNKVQVPADVREMSLGSGATGGFAAPETWAAGFWSAVNNASVFLPRCRTFSFEGNNVLHVVAWDSEDQTAGPFGGVAATWTGEGVTSTPVTPSIRNVDYKANKLSMYVDVTREAAAHAQRLVAELGSQMTRAAVYEFDNQIVNGNGLARPTGILNSGSAIDVARAAGNQIAYEDVMAMYARLYPGFIGGAAWFGSPDILPELLSLQDPGNRYIWIPSDSGVANARPGSLLGLPLFLSDKCPKLGTRGDLILADLSAYGICVAEQVVLERSDSAKWYEDMYSFRSILRADGCALMDNEITPKNGGATLSWAVVLS